MVVLTDNHFFRTVFVSFFCVFFLFCYPSFTAKLCSDKCAAKTGRYSHHKSCIIYHSGVSKNRLNMAYSSCSACFFFALLLGLPKHIATGKAWRATFPMIALLLVRTRCCRAWNKTSIPESDGVVSETLQAKQVSKRNIQTTKNKNTNSHTLRLHANEVKAQFVNRWKALATLATLKRVLHMALARAKFIVRAHRTIVVGQFVTCWKVSCKRHSLARHHKLLRMLQSRR